MNTPLEMLQGFEDVGVRFGLASDGSIRISVPKTITLTPEEIEKIKVLKPDIILAINKGELLPLNEEG